MPAKSTTSKAAKTSALALQWHGPSLPKAIYLHIPFCVSRCPFCDFFVVIRRDSALQERFTERLLLHLDAYTQQPGLLSEVETLFIGGGTPSLLEPHLLSRLIEKINKALCRDKNPLRLAQAKSPQGIGSTTEQVGLEVSMETNPELLSEERLEFWSSLGIRRLSIGLQSHSDELLKKLGRRSRRAQHESLARLLARKRQFFDSYSFDFLYGIPGQNLADIEDTLRFIAQHKPQHVSYYQLGIAEDTLFGRWQKEGRLPDMTSNAVQDDIAAQWDAICSGLSKLGYLRYEVSNFALDARPRQPSLPTHNIKLPRYHSRHNMMYWQWQPYLALGPSAVGASLVPASELPSELLQVQKENANHGQKCKWGQDARVLRWQGSHKWQDFFSEADYGIQLEACSREESLFEFLMMGLRLPSGIERSRLEKLFGPLEGHIPESLSWGRSYGLLADLGQGRIAMSDKGLELLDSFLWKVHEELGL